jgi:hypothetical protein
MEKHIIQWGYWLGVVCVVLALVTRALNVLGVVSVVVGRGNPIGYRSFLDGALLFFVAAIATSSYAWFKAHKPQA